MESIGAPHRKDVLNHPVCILFGIWQEPCLRGAPRLLLCRAALPMSMLWRPASSCLLLHVQEHPDTLLPVANA